MPILTNFAEVKGLDPLPDGTYLAKVVHSEEGLSAQQQPKIELRWEIIAPENYAGRIVFDILSFHADAMFRTKEVLKGMGFDENFNGEISAEMLLNRECAITLRIEQSNKTDDEGNAYPPRNKVRKVRPAEKYSPNGGDLGVLATLEMPTEAEPEPEPTVARSRKTR